MEREEERFSKRCKFIIVIITKGYIFKGLGVHNYFRGTTLLSVRLLIVSAIAQANYYDFP